MNLKPVAVRTHHN